VGDTTILVVLVATVVLAGLVAALALVLWASRRTSGHVPDLAPLQSTLAALQETARNQSQQVSELARSLADLSTATSQLQIRTQATEQHQIQLQSGLQRLSESVRELQGKLDESARQHLQHTTTLAQALQQLATRTAELQSRTQTSEQRQVQLQDALQRLGELLTELRSSLHNLSKQHDTTSGRIDQLQQALATAQQALLELRRNDEEARRQQEELARFIARIDAVLTGSASRGAAGEHVLEAILEHLPAEFKAFDLRIRNRIVEFAFRLPNGKHVPVDSKWVGVHQLEELEETGSEQVRRELEALLERRIDDVTAYLDPELTLGLAIIAVPDAVYRWTQRLHARALERGVVVISYSMAIPYFLTLLHFAIRFLREENSARISALSHQLEQALRTMESELNGRFAKGLTMLQNSRDALARETASALGSLRQLQALSGATPPALVEEMDGDDLYADAE